MKTIFKYTTIIMLITLAIGLINTYPLLKYTALIAFISFIIYKIKKYKSKPSKEEMGLVFLAHNFRKLVTRVRKYEEKTIIQNQI